ncbi:hypothetical protein K493DRAFT_73263 [Basidiobolus meristosporus CBS 931.73]|uniref:A-kinase anchor protein 7-like phosphoesterase domain-containing protein n=1 Tax=Basidiobolus meristosporus CBS 931.73 TaxID=1314790 RepID=A0A1Y1XT45_9FUNG|nr:hypothetical protein K493DRAFT_73263 [Basidiobolus meristosporus CBS 931.73]|eukprot:ORX88922.1 hypothetical protein K493DRAFT_73263 [Basidiobolus meristosporus CBS 931.73]
MSLRLNMSEGIFGFGRVVYARMEESHVKERLSLMVKQLRARFVEYGLAARQDGFEFQPHATLMKVRFERARHQSANHSTHIPQDVYEPFLGKPLLCTWPRAPENSPNLRYPENDFGSCRPDAIELSSMLRPKVQGYYQAIGRVVF